MIVSGAGKYFVKKNHPPKSKESFRAHIRKQKNYLICKRIFDIIFSLLVIIFLLSWLIPVIGLAIVLGSKGPVFFIQKRVGYMGRSFYCYKFRTMVVNREANCKQAVEDDPRITKVGRFLRICNLDELPQFFNVLTGQMSVVGPRPHMHRDCSDFSNVVRNYKFRNLARPGITGLAQVKGYRGPAKDMESIFGRYQWDSFYVRYFSFSLDVWIIRLTVQSTLRSIFSQLFRLKQKTKTVLYRVKIREYLN